MAFQPITYAGQYPPPNTLIGIGRRVLRGAARLAVAVPAGTGEGGGQDTQRGDASQVCQRGGAFPEGSPRQGELRPDA